jgi:GTP-binding protein HflX
MFDVFQQDSLPRALLVAVQLPDVGDDAFGTSLDELERLVRTLGLEVMGRETQRRPHFDASTYLGPGKVAEVRERLEADAADQPDWNYVVVVNHEITPSQARELSKAVGAEVLDRTAVILEIFHRHARSREARVQVELVRLAYVAPRIREMQKGRSARQQGGIGGKGTGESYLELDRRKVRDRIAELRAELARIETGRVTQRSRRRDARRVALVGYTNAGKSTLMRALTASEVYVADKLFATLDTTVRTLQPEVRPRILVSDTVGFLRDLPHGLVASFKSTLDEALESSLLLHVVDASDPAFEDQMRTTDQVLAEIGAGDIPTQLVFNKVDRIDAPSRRAMLADGWPDAWRVSAHDPADVARVHAGITAFFQGALLESWVSLRHDQGALRARMFDECEVLESSYDADGGRYRVRTHRATLARLLAEADAKDVD